MRWKLLLITSLLAAGAGAGASLWIARALGLDRSGGLNHSPLAVAAALLFPIASTVFAGIFVYRHTPRRRALQAMATALFAALLTLAALVAAAVFLSNPSNSEPRPAPTPPIKTVG